MNLGISIKFSLKIKSYKSCTEEQNLLIGKMNRRRKT